MKLYAFTNETNIISVSEELWERGYISSTLRSMVKPQNVIAGILY